MRRGRGKPTQAAPIQAGPPQDSPLPGEFPSSPIGMMGGMPGPTPPPLAGMHKGAVSKAKGRKPKGRPAPSKPAAPPIL